MTGHSFRQIVTDKFSVSEAQWRECVDEHLRTGESLVRLFCARGFCREEDLLRELGRTFGIRFTRIEAGEVDQDAVADIPAKIATHYSFMPLREKDGRLYLAVSDPFMIPVFDEIRLFLGQEIRIELATHQDIMEAIKGAYGLGAETIEAMVKDEPHDLELVSSEREGDIEDNAIDPSVIKFLNQVLQDAIRQRATDIHFEPFDDELRIRYRVDGLLYEISCPPSIKRFQSSIASRIKIMARLDIAEKRRPQDGRIEVKMDGEIYDLRVSIMPTPHGESIGIRLLPRSSPILGFESLGLSPRELAVLDKAIKKPHGIILVTGPTGSGKTTTLYSCLSTINSVERKILTIEDPIEYQLKGIIQMQVETKIGFAFATALRSMLRHDPDVMMVGEIRDTETAELAVRTALTGHLVFSTLHTNDAAGGVTRLLDMGTDSFLLASSVILIIAQRLVRIICPSCRERYRAEPSAVACFPHDKGWDGMLWRGAGCEKCRGSGYKGRTGIFEMLEINEQIRESILMKNPSTKVKQKAVALGMKTLRDSGWEKIKAGVTTVEEVLRVTQEEIAPS
ncbi:MAG: GspE/PulE family protein [Deltaproteobacteria bacterium]